MSRRTDDPALPRLPIHLEDLPETAARRDRRIMVSFTESELAMIQRVARERGEQPAVLCRSIVLTAFQNSAARALAGRPEASEPSPAETVRHLLELLGKEP